MYLAGLEALLLYCIRTKTTSSEEEKKNLKRPTLGSMLQYYDDTDSEKDDSKKDDRWHLFIRFNFSPHYMYISIAWLVALPLHISLCIYTYMYVSAGLEALLLYYMYI